MRVIFKKGIGLIEVVVGASIIVVAVLALINTYNTYVSYALNNSKNVQAALLAEEGVEAVKFLRDSGWSNISSLSPSSTYYLSWGSNKWNLTTTAQPYVDGVFLRTITVTAVNRNSSTQDIASTGTNDANTKKVTVNVAYPSSKGTTTSSVSTYITNLFAD